MNIHKEGTLMIKELTVALVLSVSTLHAETHGYVERQNFARKGTERAVINSYIKGSSGGKWGWSAFSSTSANYSLAYAGPTFAPAKWMELSLSLGLETNSDPFRRALSLWMGKGKNSLVYINENGGTGPWEKLLLVHALSPRVSAGILSQSFVGSGPYAEVKLSRKKKILFYGAYLTRGDGNQVLTGLRLKF